MFRKKRSASTSNAAYQNPNAAPSAASAAALAFLKKQQSDANLSSAAAAAALRSQTTSPEPIANIQTKRMVRRNSQNSVGSPHGSLRQPFSSGVQRRSSNASMTERTFRSPSPGPRNPPPVPTIPEDVPPLPTKSHMRNASQETTTSQTPNLTAPTQSNVGVARAASTAQKPQATSRSTPVKQQPVQATKSSPGNRGSVNFSRPMSPPPAPSARMVTEAPPARPASSQGFHSLSVAAQVRQAARDRASNAGAPVARTASRPTSSAGPPATHAATLAARPGTSGGQMSSQNAMPPSSSTRPMSPSGKALPSTSTSRPQSPPASRPAPATSSTQQSTAVGSVKPGPASIPAKQSPQPRAVRAISPTNTSSTPAAGFAKPARPTLNNSSPSQEQIKAFQTKAAAMLARPRTDVVEPSSQAAPQPARRSASGVPASSVNVVQQHSRAVSQPTSMLSSGPSVNRTQSVSPSRSAHFAEFLLDPTQHQPLPRAASPAKSAMKGSSSRPMSPAFGSNAALSDTSDVASEADSNAPGKKKKKSVRVSFDEQAAIVGSSTTPQSPGNNVLSQQYRSSDTESWQAEDSKMAPRPMLPSFGSVRGRKTPTNEASVGDEQSDEQTREAVQPESSTSTEPGPASSTDDAAGSVLAHDFALRGASSDTSTLEVREGPAPNNTSIPSISVLPSTPRLDEGRELHEQKTAPTVDDQHPADGDDAAAADQSTAQPTMPSMPTETQRTNVPTIQSIMANGSLEAGNESDSTAELYEDAAEEPSDLEDGGGFASLDAIIESPAAESAPVTFPANVPISAGDLPTVPIAAAHVLSQEVPGSVGTTSSSVPGEAEDWERVKTYWASLSEQRKLQLETEAAALKVEQEAPQVQAVKQPAPKKSKAKKATPSQSEPSLPPWPDKQYQQSAEKPVQMKQSMRSTPHQRVGSDPDSTHMRSTMRGDGPARGGSMKSSLRSDRNRPSSSYVEPSPRTSTTNRPTSAAGVTQQPKAPAKQENTANAAATLAKAIHKRQQENPVLRRTNSNDSSASESSFRKKRRGSVASSDAGRYSMKKSMRGSAAAPQPSARPTSPPASRFDRLSMRSPSPSMKKGTMGSSRMSVDSATPTLRSSGGAQAQKSSSQGLFSKAPKAKPTKGKSAPNFRSRFADSSDEEDGGGRGMFSSRFADSDDSDDEPARTLRPVRGIPRKGNRQSGESTELSDSDEATGRAGKTKPTVPALTTTKAAEVAAAQPSTPTKPAANGAASEGTLLSAGTLRGDTSAPSSPSQPKAKRGLFGFGRKKAQGEAPASPSPATPTSPVVNSPAANKTSTAPVTADPQSTAASEKPVTIPKTMRGHSAAPSMDRGRKMFRRFSSSNAGSPTRAPTAADYPYPPPPIPDQYKTAPSGADRPSTSDGVGPSLRKSMRPQMGDKRESAMTVPDTSAEPKQQIYSEKTGKKKRFQGLRRMLNVYD